MCFTPVLSFQIAVIVEAIQILGNSQGLLSAAIVPTLRLFISLKLVTSFFVFAEVCMEDFLYISEMQTSIARQSYSAVCYYKKH